MHRKLWQGESLETGTIMLSNGVTRLVRLYHDCKGAQYHHGVLAALALVIMKIQDSISYKYTLESAV